MNSGRMLPSDSLDIEVDVHSGDDWWPGYLEQRRHAGDTWEGYVRYSTGPAENRICWIAYTDLRQQAPRPDMAMSAGPILNP